jgi:S-adenosyl-L-methionine hydrolase (adenosine-forming)
MPAPVITLLTDFGSSDHYVAAMKGVISGICRDARLIDISHDIAPFAIPEAAYTLSQAWPCFPAGTIHLVVVDPGVGSARRPILAEGGGHLFVAPDNGVLTMVLDALPEQIVREITASNYFRQPVSRTFHGRDIFAPAAAHLAAGVPPASFGERTEDAVRLGFSKPVAAAEGCWTGAVLKIDRFGNMVTNFDWASFHWVAEGPFRLQVASRPVVSRSVQRYCSCYADAPPGEIFVVRGSGDYLEISANQGDAAKILGADATSQVSIASSPAPARPDRLPH